jgi:hypothetical protein
MVMRDPYVHYMERLTGAVVLMVLGLAVVAVGLHWGMDSVVVETRGDWFRMDVVDNGFLFGPFVGAFGLFGVAAGEQIAVRAMRQYHQLRRTRAMASAAPILSLFVTIATAMEKQDTEVE